MGIMMVFKSLKQLFCKLPKRKGYDFSDKYWAKISISAAVKYPQTSCMPRAVDFCWISKKDRLSQNLERNFFLLKMLPLFAYQTPAKAFFILLLLRRVGGKSSESHHGSCSTKKWQNFNLSSATLPTSFENIKLLCYISKM